MIVNRHIGNIFKMATVTIGQKEAIYPLSDITSRPGAIIDMVPDEYKRATKRDNNYVISAKKP